MKQKKQFAFNKGFGQVPHALIKDVRAEIMQTLGINNMQTWHNRLSGKIEPRISEAEKIMAVFAKYNIHDIWG